METRSCLEVKIKSECMLSYFSRFSQQLQSASVTRLADFCCHVLDTSQMCHHPIMPQNIQKPSLSALLLEENEAENNIKNTAHINVIIAILEKTVPVLISKRDILSALTDKPAKKAQEMLNAPSSGPVI